MIPNCRGVRPTRLHIKTWSRLAMTLAMLCTVSACNPLRPRRIDNSKQRVAPELLAANQLPIERGKPRPVIDATGWVVGIPGKILLWNRRVDNHSISVETESTLREYLDANDLQHVKVRLNQYRPWDDMKRLTKNRTVAWPWRATLGTLSVLGEAVIPGRIFGGDHYNPYTATIHLYSDVPAIALHEAAHAKDFSRRAYPGTYAALYALPVVPLYHESVASADVMAYVQSLGRPDLQRQANNVLYPAYGTYVGGAAGVVAPVAAAPIYYGSVLGGHIAGRMESRRIPSNPSSGPSLYPTGAPRDDSPSEAIGNPPSDAVDEPPLEDDHTIPTRG